MLLSIVVPVYNEQEALPKLLSSIELVMAVVPYAYELVLVDDGSSDGSAALLRHAAESDSRIKVLFFSRNFGHQAAITAGLDCASGDAVAVIDADLQDPPELLPQMVKLFEEGYDVVSAQRIARDGDGRFKRFTAWLFYWIFRKMVSERIQPEVGDFRLFSRRAILAIRQLREQHRFMRGMVAWLGLKEVVLPYRRQARVAGTTKYPALKMLRFAWTAISSFSALPLRLSVFLGMLCTATGIGYGLYSVYAAVVLEATVPGWTSLVILNIVFSGATLICIGLVGDYVGRIYEESKGRPLYVVSNTVNIEPSQPPLARSVMLPPPESPYEPASRKPNRV